MLQSFTISYVVVTSNLLKKYFGPCQILENKDFPVKLMMHFDFR